MHPLEIVQLTALMQRTSGRADGVGVIAGPELSIIRCARMMGMCRGPPQISIVTSFPTLILFFIYVSAVATLGMRRELLCKGLA